jgi:hypothetical protein
VRVEEMRDELATARAQLDGAVPCSAIDAYVDKLAATSVTFSSVITREIVLGVCADLTALTVIHAAQPATEGGLQAELDGAGNFVVRDMRDGDG